MSSGGGGNEAAAAARALRWKVNMARGDGHGVESEGCGMAWAYGRP